MKLFLGIWLALLTVIVAGLSIIWLLDKAYYWAVWLLNLFLTPAQVENVIAVFIFTGIVALLLALFSDD